jgi:hypothetical protein
MIKVTKKRFSADFKKKLSGSEDAALFYTGLTRKQKTTLALVGLKVLVDMHHGDPDSILNYLEEMAAS